MPPKGPPQPSKEQMQSAMNDMQHIAMQLQPSKGDPNATISLERIVIACATSPGMIGAIPADHPSKTDEVEAALKKADIKIDWIKEKGMGRKNAIFLYWKLHRQQKEFKKVDDELDVPTQQHASACQQITMKLMMQAQMLLPHQNWVAASMAVARASALFANQVWSHEDAEALEIMAEVLKGEGLRAPKLRLEAAVEPEQVDQNGNVSVKVKLHRDHHGFDGSKPPEPADPSGTYEAYWMYVIAQAPKKKEANVFVAVQPLMTKDLNDKVIECEAKFKAPPRRGTQKLTIFVTSTSTIGVDLEMETSFRITDQRAPDEEPAKAMEKLSVGGDDDDDIGIKLK